MYVLVSVYARARLCLYKFEHQLRDENEQGNATTIATIQIDLKFQISSKLRRFFSTLCLRLLYVKSLYDVANCLCFILWNVFHAMSEQYLQ